MLAPLVAARLSWRPTRAGRPADEDKSGALGVSVVCSVGAAPERALAAVYATVSAPSCSGWAGRESHLLREAQAAETVTGQVGEAAACDQLRGHAFCPDKRARWSRNGAPGYFITRLAHAGQPKGHFWSGVMIKQVLRKRRALCGRAPDYRRNLGMTIKCNEHLRGALAVLLDGAGPSEAEGCQGLANFCRSEANRLTPKLKPIVWRRRRRRRPDESCWPATCVAIAIHLQGGGRVGARTLTSH